MSPPPPPPQQHTAAPAAEPPTARKIVYDLNHAPIRHVGVQPAPLPGALSSARLYKMVEKVRGALAARGGTTFRHLSIEFRIMDDNRDQKLSPEEFKMGLCDLGCRHFGWSAADWRGLFAAFDADGSGTVDQTEFLKAVRGTLSAARKDFVMMAFNILDVDGSGIIGMHEMRRRFKGDDLRELMRGLGDKNSDSCISFDEFEDYYCGLSANYDSDEEFELMMRNAWHIPGGIGAAANTANTRVLVTHLDGSQSVECIEDDLGLDVGDHAAVIRQLKKQGLWDVQSVSRAGDV